MDIILFGFPSKRTRLAKTKIKLLKSDGLFYDVAEKHEKQLMNENSCDFICDQNVDNLLSDKDEMKKFIKELTIMMERSN